MIEGEGTVSWRFRNPNVMEPLVSVGNTEVETIATVLRLVGAGCVGILSQSSLGTKTMWQWTLHKRADVVKLLAQIIPYLTGKQGQSKALLWTLTRPISGSSCHPTHILEPADTVHNTPEQIERNWQEFFKQDRVDPRAIRRQHRWKFGHEPDYDHPDSGWVYLNLKVESPPSDPDQRGLLTGGPESGLPCERCGEMTRVAGRMSVWDMMHQVDAASNPLVHLVNEEDITETRRHELQQEFIVILACPNCRLKWQWREEFLPKVTAHD